MKWIVCFLFVCSNVFSWEFQDKTVAEYGFEWDRKEDFQEAAQIFADSFLRTYREFLPQQLGVDDIETFLMETIEDELLLKEEHPDTIHWLIAKDEGEVVGLLIIELDKYPEVYGRQMAIAPNYLWSGVGTQLANVALENLPEASRFVAITRVVNQVSARFFESLGLTRVEFMHEGYDPNKYVGYEYYP